MVSSLVSNLQAKTGISSLVLSRYLGVNYDTAWLLHNKILRAMTADDSNQQQAPIRSIRTCRELKAAVGTSADLPTASLVGWVGCCCSVNEQSYSCGVVSSLTVAEQPRKAC